jgi:hypothetical protein
MPADVSAQAQSRFLAYARKTAPTISPAQQSVFCVRLSAALHEKLGVQSSERAASPNPSLTYADLALLREKDHPQKNEYAFPAR